MTTESTVDPQPKPFVGPLSGLPPTKPQGPRRIAPRYYAGEHVGNRRVNHRDVERHANGAMPGIRDKFARRLIRRAFKEAGSRVELGIVRAKALRAQALEIAKDKRKSVRWGLRLLDQELALHQEVPQPKTRSELRRAKRESAKARV